MILFPHFQATYRYQNNIHSSLKGKIFTIYLVSNDYYLKKIGVSLLTALFISAAVPSQAQIQIGAKGGVNISQLSGLSIPDVKTQAYFGFHVGGYVTFHFGKLALQPELVYSTQGAKLEQSTSSENLTLNYFNIPVMLKYYSQSGLFLETGPQLGFNTSAKFGQGDISQTVKGSDFSWCAGIGFQGHKAGLGVRYNIGISKLGETSTTTIENADYKNGVLQISLYFKIFGK